MELRQGVASTRATLRDESQDGEVVRIYAGWSMSCQPDECPLFDNRREIPLHTHRGDKGNGRFLWPINCLILYASAFHVLQGRGKSRTWQWTAGKFTIKKRSLTKYRERHELGSETSTGQTGFYAGVCCKRAGAAAESYNAAGTTPISLYRLDWRNGLYDLCHLTSSIATTYRRR